MYFQPFPKLSYTLDDKVSYQTIQDIFRRVVLSYNTRIKNSYFTYYEVGDGETPEVVSHKFYRNTNFHWIILHANEIIDPRWDWVLSQLDLLTYVQDKYGVGNEYAIHHWEYVVYEGTTSEQKLISPTQDAYYNTSISNWEYEDTLNEAKRKIKIIVPALVPNLQKEFINLIKA